MVWLDSSASDDGSEPDTDSEALADDEDGDSEEEDTGPKKLRKTATGKKVPIKVFSPVGQCVGMCGHASAPWHECLPHPCLLSCFPFRNCLAFVKAGSSSALLWLGTQGKGKGSEKPESAKGKSGEGKSSGTKRRYQRKAWHQKDQKGKRPLNDKGKAKVLFSSPSAFARAHGKKDST